MFENMDNPDRVDTPPGYTPGGCSYCQGPLGGDSYDFDGKAVCADCVNDWIDSADAPEWFLLILHDDMEEYRA